MDGYIAEATNSSNNLNKKFENKPIDTFSIIAIFLNIKRKTCGGYFSKINNLRRRTQEGLTNLKVILEAFLHIS